MKNYMHIPIWRTILNWAIALGAGSIVWPLVASLFKQGPDEIDEIGAVMAISVILGGLTSLPALGLLILTNSLLNKKELAPIKFIQVHTLVHIALGLLTFFVLYAFVSNGLNGKENFIFFILGGSYMLAGLATWVFTFGLYRKKVNVREYNEDILDEL
jgi:hypothetical protein